MTKAPSVRVANPLSDAAQCAAIYAHYVRYSTATFEYDPPDVAEMSSRTPESGTQGRRTRGRARRRSTFTAGPSAAALALRSIKSCLTGCVLVGFTRPSVASPYPMNPVFVCTNHSASFRLGCTVHLDTSSDSGST
jgi:anti-sigma factor RsiW